ncbi:MAG TPA: histidine phosphatase family protein [Gemmatimonadaceae bacterium]
MRPAFLTRSAVTVAAAALLVAAAPRAYAPATVVLVVRHAERAPGTGDVPLSAEGEARARALAELGRAAGVDAIITTQYLRARQTAAPLATALNLTPEVVAAQGDVEAHARAVANAVRQRPAGSTVLVVGHSNTVAPIVAALGGARHRELCDSEYDAIFLVVLDDEGPVRTVKSRFGASTPVGTTCAPMRQG